MGRKAKPPTVASSAQPGGVKRSYRYKGPTSVTLHTPHGSIVERRAALARDRFSQAESELLITLKAAGKSSSEIAAALPGRTPRAVCAHADHLKLPPFKDREKTDISLRLSPQLYQRLESSATRRSMGISEIAGQLLGSILARGSVTEALSRWHDHATEARGMSASQQKKHRKRVRLEDADFE
jgi:hypothetical protein